MKNYQIVLPLLALAFAMSFVEKIAAEDPAICPENQELSCILCNNQTCSDIANLEIKCSDCLEFKCICKSGYYLQDKECVPADRCKVKCPENMVYLACSKKPPICGPPKSAPLDPKEICRPRCVCKDKYILAKEGSQKCILKEKCKYP
ncbi:uncharacterized protein ACMZJ9_018740 [Mantella aurantiaca]